jgi:Fe2+ transport system protein B
MLHPLISKAQVVKKLDGKDVVILTIEQAKNINKTIDSLENQHLVKDSLIKSSNNSLLNLSTNIKVQSDSSIYFQTLLEKSIKDLKHRDVTYTHEIKQARARHSIDQITLGTVTALVFFLFMKIYGK